MTRSGNSDKVITGKSILMTAAHGSGIKFMVKMARQVKTKIMLSMAPMMTLR
jgi:hypothetical protein